MAENVDERTWWRLGEQAVSIMFPGTSGAVQLFRTVKDILQEDEPKEGHPLALVAGVAGAASVGYQAYELSQKDDYLKEFDVNVHNHFINTASLLAIPLATRPKKVGAILFGGTLLFSGSYYAHAYFSNNMVKKVSRWTGGAGLFIIFIGWVEMVVGW